MRAYRICKDRLETVQETLGQYLRDGRENAEAPKPSADGDGRATRSKPSVNGNGDDDPIPY